MTEFTVRLADIPVGICVACPQTMEYCRDYITEAAPMFTVCITPEDLETERALADETAIREGRSPSPWSEPYLERLAVFRRIADRMPERNTILFHGSAVAFGDKAYVFTARSGTGKTTHTRLWLDSIPGTYVVNGDKPFLKYEDGRFFVCGTPWQGKENYGVNRIVPLGGICLLERDTTNHIETVSLREAFPALLQQTYRPETAAGVQHTLRLLGHMNEIPLFRLGCNMEPEAARVSFEAMTGTKPG